MAGADQERLIEALLTLASSQRGLHRREPLDLAQVVEEVLQDRPVDGIAVESDLRPAWISGSAWLAARMVSSLVDNALRYNVADGRMSVTTGIDGGMPILRVANTGPLILREDAALLFQPFQRLESRSADRDGHGRGLSVVMAIATAHDATVRVKPGPSGGLDIEVRFPSLGTGDRA